MKHWKRFVIAVGFVVAAVGQSQAQSFNIDVDISSGGYPAGSGVPSPTFGGAANQPGFWTRLDSASHTRPWQLYDLAGNQTSVEVRWNVSGGGRGSGWDGNTGDYRLLLNDCTLISVPTTYQFTGLQPGHYFITTYAVDRSGETFPTEITIAGATQPTRLSGTSGMPGDQLIEGVTHSIHSISILGGSFALTARAVGHHGSINGFQVTYEPVPEPASAVALALGLWLIKRRKNPSFV